MSLNEAELLFPALVSLGWSAFFDTQCTPEDVASSQPFRVMSIHRGEVHLSCDSRDAILYLNQTLIQDLGDTYATVGDWFLLDREGDGFVRVLERKSVIKRQAAGSDNSQQMVAANIDTLFIVTSCNDDFNLSRLERYLTFAHDAGVAPVVILTKYDMCDSPQDYEEKARSLGQEMTVISVNALDANTLSDLKEWCGFGQTVALVGSSGVGKSTLVNSLGAHQQRTAEIREDDARGRHTTTHRSLLPLETGAVLLDSPGMRGVGLADSEVSVAEVFDDIAELASQCKFSDCQHDKEPGCKVKKALKDGSISPRRFSNYNKLMTEQDRNASAIAERRKKEKETSKFHRKVKAAKRMKKK